MPRGWQELEQLERELAQARALLEVKRRQLEYVTAHGYARPSPPEAAAASQLEPGQVVEAPDPPCSGSLRLSVSWGRQLACDEQSPRRDGRALTPPRPCIKPAAAAAPDTKAVDPWMGRGRRRQRLKERAGASSTYSTASASTASASTSSASGALFGHPRRAASPARTTAGATTLEDVGVGLMLAGAAVRSAVSPARSRSRSPLHSLVALPLSYIPDECTNVLTPTNEPGVSAVGAAAGAAAIAATVAFALARAGVGAAVGL